MRSQGSDESFNSADCFFANPASNVIERIGSLRNDRRVFISFALLRLLTTGYGTFRPIDQLEIRSAHWDEAEAPDSRC
jgi:hypothetical protein